MNAISRESKVIVAIGGSNSSLPTVSSYRRRLLFPALHTSFT